MKDDPHFGVGSGASALIHITAINVSESQPIAAGQPIEVAFDRLLLPSSVTRQSLVLSDLLGNFLSPGVIYDPVSRVVRIVPATPLQPGQSYKLNIIPANSPTDGNGLRAIDGATLDPGEHSAITFPVVAPSTDGGAEAAPEGGVDAGMGGGSEAGADAGVVNVAPPTVDFCASVLPIFVGRCNGSGCHGTALPAAGLRLDSPADIAATAVGRAAQGANTGPRAAPQPGGRLFGEDMPIVDPGAPGDSWLMYKLLLAVPRSPTVASDLYSVPWGQLPDDERATLASYVLGREMPFPLDPAGAPGTDPSTLTLDELDAVSFWIAEGAPVPPCFP
ncbi:MAG TPA: hypothetical protein VIF15_03655 [Polyangiaceae bacterium]